MFSIWLYYINTLWEAYYKTFLQISLSNFVGKWNPVILMWLIYVGFSPFMTCFIIIFFLSLFCFAFSPVVELRKVFHYSFSPCSIWKLFFQWLFLCLTGILSYFFNQGLKLIIIFILLLNTTWVQPALITHQVVL